MARTRQGAPASTGGTTSDNSTARELKQAPTKKRGASDSKAQQQGPAKKLKNSPEPSNDNSEPSEPQEAEEQQPLPRLTTPDLEFDWDRSKLKDPRPTPGRERRPRYDEHDMPSELAARRPPSPEKPKGRLNAMQKEALFEENGRRDPAHTFHHLYKCRDKGPHGSPTYDRAGFRLDYNKVIDWFKPVRYNKKRMVKGMENSVARAQTLDEHTIEAFFEDSEEAKEKLSGKGPILYSLVRDTISKDLGVPLHKIDHADIGRWVQKGFKKHKVEDWMTYSDEDKKRDLKMMSGSRLRA
ncbi:hypothetical protein SLS64_000183 [Diaporthe eres]|uniref:Uncharacterized protein n=1 Tax=Diaporthe eres TaxID=83184 RepID=A0ABR1NPT0_DIAER